MRHVSYAHIRGSIKRIQGQIRALLVQHKVEGIQFLEDCAMNTLCFEFAHVCKHAEGDRPIVVRIGIPTWSRSEVPWYARGHEARIVLEEARRERQVWRLLYLYLTAHLKAIEFGLWSFEDAFFTNIVVRDGQTLGEVIRRQVEDGNIALALSAQAGSTHDLRCASARPRSRAHRTYPGN